MIEFREQIIFRIKDNYNRINHAISILTEEEIWKRPNEFSNSIGNLILHLCGNLNQFIIEQYWVTDLKRNRPFEFSVIKNLDKSELNYKLSETVIQSCQIISALTEIKLKEKIKVNENEYSGIGILIHTTQHFAYHSAQIMYWTKALKNIDLKFNTVIKKECIKVEC